jgi:hypothetical protein
MATKLNLNRIVISRENAALLDEALAADFRAQGIRKGPAADALIAAASIAEARLTKSGVAVSNRTGCEYEFREAGPWAKAYNNTKKVVAYRIRRTAKGWVVVQAGNDTVHPRQPEINRVVLTAKAKDAVVRTALSPFGLLPQKPAQDMSVAA